MGNAMAIVCDGCTKENFGKRDSYFVNESDNSAPKALIDIKVNARNFVVQRNTNIDDIYEKIEFLGQENALRELFQINTKLRENIRGRGK